MLHIRNRYDRGGNIITPNDFGTREPPEGFMDFLVEMYTPIDKSGNCDNVMLLVTNDQDQKRAS